VIDWFQKYKPAAPARVHLLLAALMWTAVGGALLFFGIRWALVGRMPHVRLLLAVAATAGLAKARWVLWRAAGRIVERIKQRGDGRCLGGFVSWRTWLLIILMITAGRLLRGGLLPSPVVGLIYAAVGTALLAGSFRVWLAWGQRADSL
jgi:hypothetical protein